MQSRTMLSLLQRRNELGVNTARFSEITQHCMETTATPLEHMRANPDIFCSNAWDRRLDASCLNSMPRCCFFLKGERVA